MSDQYYREQSARRARYLWLVGGLLVVLLCGSIGVMGVMRDACTGTYERSPEAVIRSYVESIAKGEINIVKECWEHQAFLDLENGCNEICLQRFYGEKTDLAEVSVPAIETAANGRHIIRASVAVTCQATGETETGEVHLDSVGADLPWRHWSIVYSTVGGTVSEPWCK